jgi:hypothetical protein
MKILFLDFDGVLNSYQSATFWHTRRDQMKWENEMYRDWPGTLKEYIAQEFCPIALSNVEELCRRELDLRIVVSSTWRMGETVETLKEILKPSKIVCDRLIGTTPIIYKDNHEVPRGIEIQHWLDNYEFKDQITGFAILDDDGDMEHLMNKLVQTDVEHGFKWTDIKKVQDVLNGGPCCTYTGPPFDKCKKCGGRQSI